MLCYWHYIPFTCLNWQQLRHSFKISPMRPIGSRQLSSKTPAKQVPPPETGALVIMDYLTQLVKWMSPLNKRVTFGCQYSKLLAVQLSICDSCLAGVCYGQLVTGVKFGCWWFSLWVRWMHWPDRDKLGFGCSSLQAKWVSACDKGWDGH